MYIIVVIYQSILSAYNFSLVSYVISIGIGMSVFLMSGTKDMKSNLLSINDRVIAESDQLQVTFKELCDVIQLQASLKQLSSLPFLKKCIDFKSIIILGFSAIS